MRHPKTAVAGSQRLAADAERVRAVHANVNQPAMSKVPPSGVTAPNQRGAPKAIAYKVAAKINAPADQSRAGHAEGAAMAPTAKAWVSK
jgi:hypothetical protein